MKSPHQPAIRKGCTRCLPSVAGPRTASQMEPSAMEPWKRKEGTGMSADASEEPLVDICTTPLQMLLQTRCRQDEPLLCRALVPMYQTQCG